MDGPSWDSVQSFITARSISGSPVEVKAPSYQCHICRGSFEEHKLKHHLRDIHGHQMVCSYCADFKCTTGHFKQFLKHLRLKHPEIAHNDALISKPSLTRPQLNNLVYQHSSLRPPDVVLPTPEDQVHGNAALPNS